MFSARIEICPLISQSNSARADHEASRLLKYNSDFAVSSCGELGQSARGDRGIHIGICRGCSKNEVRSYSVAKSHTICWAGNDWGLGTRFNAA
jgi:hypothetical protein